MMDCVSSLRINLMADSCGHEIESSYSITNLEFLEKVSDYQFLKEDSTAWSY
jgi:hypothetical protein